MSKPKAIGKPQRYSSGVIPEGVVSGATVERVAFVAPMDCQVDKAYVTPIEDMAAASGDYVTISLVQKGKAGSGTGVIASFDTNSAGNNISLSAELPHDFTSGTSGETLKQTFVSGGNALTLKVVNTSSGDGSPTTFASGAHCTVVWTPCAGLKEA